MSFLDYLYYRLYCFINPIYSASAEFKAAGLVAFFPMVIRRYIRIILSFFTDISPFVFNRAYLYCITWVLLDAFISYRYIWKDKRLSKTGKSYIIDQLHQRWKDEPIKQKRIRGGLIIFFYGVVLLFDLIYIILKGLRYI